MHHKYPEDYNNLTLKKIGKEVSCDVKVNYDGSVYLTKCLVNNREVLDENNQDNYYQYGTKKYGIGELVSYNGMDFYVIEASDESSDRVTMLKAEPLTVDEVNTYGGVGTDNNHVNMYIRETTSSYYQKAYDQNGYGGMSYYTSETCGYANGPFTFVGTGCTTAYDESEVKYVVDAWALDKIINSDLVDDKLGYKVRLITYEDLTNNLGYNTETYHKPNAWLYNSNYIYWTMSSYEDSAELVRSVGGYSSGVGPGSIFSNHHLVVRPVVTIKKSVI